MKSRVLFPLSCLFFFVFFPATSDAAGPTNIAATMNNLFAEVGNLVPVKIHVPVELSNLPPEVEQVGVRCAITINGVTVEESVVGRARNGGRTMIVPFSIPNSEDRLSGSYTCSLWLKYRRGNSLVELGWLEIGSVVELDPAVSSQRRRVRGYFDGPSINN